MKLKIGSGHQVIGELYPSSRGSDLYLWLKGLSRAYDDYLAYAPWEPTDVMLSLVMSYPAVMSYGRVIHHDECRF